MAPAETNRAQEEFEKTVRDLEGGVQGPPELVSQSDTFRHLRYPGKTETYQSGGFDGVEFNKGFVKTPRGHDIRFYRDNFLPYSGLHPPGL